MIALLSLLLSSSLSFAVGTVIEKNVEYREYDFNGVDKIQVSNGAGRIQISPMPLNKIEITASKRKFTERCAIHIAKEEATRIVIRVERPLGEICEVDFDLRVPKDISVDVTSGSGNVAVSDINGDLRFDLGSGNLTASGRFKSLNGKTGSGDVDVKGLTGGVDLKVGSGQVKLGFEDNARGKVAVNSGSGSATLLFPKGTKAKTALKTGTGELINEIGESSRADIELNVSTGSGDLSLRTY